MKLVCSRCGDEFKNGDSIVRIDTKYTILKVDENGIIRNYDNISDTTSEMLCFDCFNKYADKIDELNEEFNGQLLIDSSKIIDSIQYENNEQSE